MTMKTTIPFKLLTLTALMGSMVLAVPNFSHTAYASTNSSQVMIVVPHSSESQDTSEKSTVQSIKKEVFPVSVVETYDDRGRNMIVKRYELSRAERPENIPREDFVFGSKTYTLTDIVKDVNQNVDIKTITETVEKTSPTDTLSEVLAILDNEIEYDDGQYVGILTLDVSSITVGEAGRQSNYQTLTITRQYPHLSSQDVSLVPKTVTQNGLTYKLADVNWTAGNTSPVDYTPVGDYYTANATYTTSYSKESVTGYVVTANYIGDVGFTNTDITPYNAIFMEKRQPAQIISSVSDISNYIQNEMLDDFIKENQAASELEGQESEGVISPAPVIKEISREELLAMLNDGSNEPTEKAEALQIGEKQEKKAAIMTIVCIFIGGGAAVICYLLNKRKQRKTSFADIIPDDNTPSALPSYHVSRLDEDLTTDRIPEENESFLDTGIDDEFDFGDDTSIDDL